MADLTNTIQPGDFPLPTYILGGSHNGERRRPSDALSLTLPRVIQWFDGRPDGVPGLEVYRPFPHKIGDQKCCVWVPAEWSDQIGRAAVLDMAGRLWSHFIDPEQKGFG